MTDGDAIAYQQSDSESDPHRVIGESPPLTAEAIAEDALRRADLNHDPDIEGVAIVDGFGAKVLVERGHLALHDGVGPRRRVRRYPKVNPPRRVVVGIGTQGMVTLDAMRWCSRVGTPMVVLGVNGGLLAVGPAVREDARLLRAQALALYTVAGKEVSQYLLEEKLRGQAQVLRDHFGDEDPASTIDDLLLSMGNADTIEELRQLEAAAANVYFATFERKVEVVFNRKDASRIPSHWERFNGRRSAVNPASPRNASDVAGAVLNYAYKLAEIEAAIAARTLGLDPGIGILHADLPGRPSLACDLMEAIRPMVDAHVLDVLQGPLRKREFIEDPRGVVRCLAPLTHRLAEAMPSYGVALGPVVEHVGELLARSSPYNVSVPTVLSGSKHRDAAQRRSQSGRVSASRPQGPNPGRLAPRGKRRKKASPQPSLPIGACLGCGGQLSVNDDRDGPRIEWCPECLPERRREIGGSLYPAARAAALRIAKETGELPTHSPTAREARARGNAKQREEQRRWNTEVQDDELNLGWYEREIQPRLAIFSLPAIARTTGASTTAAGQWRSGRRIPHRRHWWALARLTGVDILPTSHGAADPTSEP